ncbi:hypothetical protein PoB_006191800 [Plakobranchus ocellatus]|uniref:Uncharacterized protein n=1 Tax=Plakobranchus ocellatus TaxID=259542 RepID=A0AAV4CU10_9GAST|nr:hypothetical protein PoB_006191800 [Plakobranchus ocellatus]
MSALRSAGTLLSRVQAPPLSPLGLTLHCDATLSAWTLVTSASPQQSDLRLLGPPSGQGAGGGAQTRDKRVPADLRAHSLATAP